jgi:hypothetical protein
LGKFGATIKSLISTYFFFDVQGTFPRSDVVLVDRATGQPIHIQDWKGNYRGALAAKQTFKRDLRSLDIEAFCEKYYVDWRPARAGPAG